MPFSPRGNMRVPRIDYPHRGLGSIAKSRSAAEIDGPGKSGETIEAWVWACRRARSRAGPATQQRPAPLRDVLHPLRCELRSYRAELQGGEMYSDKNGSSTRPTFTDQEALLFHSQGRPGKLEVVATKPMATQ